MALNAAAKEVMNEPPAAAFKDLYAAVTAVCGQPPYNTPDYPNAPNCSISDYKGVHYHAGGWELLANTTGESIKLLLEAEAQAEAAAHGAKSPEQAVVCNSSELLSRAWALHPAEDRVEIRGHAFDAEAWVLPRNPAALGPTSCPSNSTCMVTAYSSTGLGCCIGHGLAAVSCKDHVHCCPEGWSCTETCHLGGCGCVAPAGAGA